MMTHIPTYFSNYVFFMIAKIEIMSNEWQGGFKHAL